MTNRLPPVWQFSLRELFGLTTYAAVSIAVANAWKLETLVAATGCLVVWSNYQGRFRSIQTGWGRRIAIGLGACLFVGSMFLPAYRVFGDVIGWNTAWVLVWLLIPTNSFGPNGPNWLGYFLHLPWIVLTVTANLCGVLHPLTLRWPSGKLENWLGTAIHACLPIVWLLSTDDDTSNILIGYYVWVVSLTAMASTHPIDRRTILVMLATTSIFGVTRILAHLMQINV